MPNPNHPKTRNKKAISRDPTWNNRQGGKKQECRKCGRNAHVGPDGKCKRCTPKPE